MSILDALRRREKTEQEAAASAEQKRKETAERDAAAYFTELTKLADGGKDTLSQKATALAEKLGRTHPLADLARATADAAQRRHERAVKHAAPKQDSEARGKSLRDAEGRLHKVKNHAVAVIQAPREATRLQHENHRLAHRPYVELLTKPEAADADVTRAIEIVEALGGTADDISSDQSEAQRLVKYESMIGGQASAIEDIVAATSAVGAAMLAEAMGELEGAKQTEVTLVAPLGYRPLTAADLLPEAYCELDDDVSDDIDAT
ncbi:MAG: hypothetical protein AAGI54_02500 [Planctomycetota bacterium]